MQKIKRILRSTNEQKIYCYDRETYTKPMTCDTCKCTFNNKTWTIHIKTQNHKTLTIFSPSSIPNPFRSLIITTTLRRHVELTLVSQD